MNRGRVAWLLWRESLDLWRNRRLFLGVVVVPLLLAAAMTPALMVIVGRTEQVLTAQMQVARTRQEVLGTPRVVRASGPDPQQAPLPGLLHPRIAQEPPGRQVLWMLVFFSLGYVTLFPLLLPLTTGSHAIVQERAEGTLEPLLATPIRTTELLVAKVVAASVPPVLITWSSWGIQLAVAAAFLTWPLVREILVTPGWLLVVFLGAPLASVLLTLLLVVLSSRIPDARAAQQWGALVVLPVLGLQMGMLSGMVRLDERLLLVLLPLAVLLVPAFRAAERAFARGAIVALRR
ncbi:MAG: ABC transporter permease subunit [Candidatus Sericytochromatia bacterium]|nr:ABC transporter permease subunit [Candidatus Sericytochromatia bacterium]